jgi:hypothetical protein
MRHPIPLHRAPFAAGLAFLLAASAVPVSAQMSQGSQDGMEGMGTEPIQPKPVPAPMAKPTKPASSGEMPIAPAAKPTKATQGMITMAPPKSAQAQSSMTAMAPVSGNAKQEKTNEMGSTPMKSTEGMSAQPTPGASNAPMGGMPTSSSQGQGMNPTPGSSGAIKEMEEPQPSSLSGGLILAIFAALNAGVIAIAAVMKIKRNNQKASSEVKA